ncbi:hypothetical protein EJB05_34418, partial [Eragrostis curvula]
MVIDPLFDGLDTPAITKQPYDGSSSSQQELTMYNYILSNPLSCPPLTNASSTQLSSAFTIPGLYNVSSNVGRNQLQVAATVSPDYQRIGSNNALHYISQMLMEDVDERIGLHQGEDALQAAEKPFYDILAQVHPSSLNWLPLHRNSEEDSNDENTYYKRLRRTSPSFGKHRKALWIWLPCLQLKRGVDEAKGFDKLVIYLDRDRLSICRLTTKAKVGEKNRFALFRITDHRNNPFIRDLNDIGRKEQCHNFLRSQGKGHAQQKLRGKKQLKKEVVDLRSLLVHCAQAVAADDRQLASELVRKIRQHSSADGDCTQRLAFYLVDGLEARLAGIGSRVYYKLMAKRVSDEAVFKTYKLYLAACPFYRASYTFANQTIIEASKGKPRVHIVDFGICFGFQWPSLIQQFAELGVPPKLRITGIDVPRPGFRPLEIIEEAGKRLADYAKRFEVPFEYQGISSRFETIQIEDLNIEEGELLIINCMDRMENLGDETVAMNSARDRVLKIMRRMNPNVFILGIVNGSYSSPFFITRFKEVMFHYSSIFDMLDANVPRDDEARKMLERGKFARDALNIIACEGAERTERPETYKQWQVRCLKAGFEQLPVDPVVLNSIHQMKKEMYHEDFVADDDSGWLLQGWKGRVIHAISKWRPNSSYADLHSLRLFVSEKPSRFVGCEIQASANSGAMDSSEYFEINSNITLDYINQILMEDGTTEKVSIHQQHDALQAMEKPFYDILGQTYPSSSRDTLISSESQTNFPNCISNYYQDQSCSDSIISDSRGPNVTQVIDTWASELDNAVFQFNRGAEEAKKLVPIIKKLAIDIESNDLFASKRMTEVTIGQQSKHINRTRSHPDVDLELLEGRTSKHSAISACETIRDETFDCVLLCDWQLCGDVAHLREMKTKEPHKCPCNVQSSGYDQGQDKQQEAVDLRALLMQCAQAIASNNLPFACELLRKIRNHSSPYGDGSQRLAAYFADSLEARLAGTGSQMYKKLMGTRTSARDMLKAYRLFIAACPFVRVANYFSNQTIVDVLEGRPRVHIIDFGISFGFQWPSLIQRFAKRDGGPPKLRITGIDYQGIASRWENICIEDINIDKDEVLIINCLLRIKNLGDETEDMDSARDRVLRNMKRMSPEVIIIGIVNGSFSSPFFLPRFREVLFYYSTLLDMLDTTLDRNHEARILIERDLLGANVLNVVACEGAERI